MSPKSSSFPLQALCAAILAGAAALSPSFAAEPASPLQVAGSNEEGLEDSAEGPEAAQIKTQPNASAAAQTDSADPAAEPGKPAMDPEFLKRQKEADEKLKAEAAPVAPEHRLAKSYPHDYIVVCEAGCRSRARDEIVSRMPKPTRRANAAGAFEPTSAQQSASIECDAGCRPGDNSHASRLPTPATTAAPEAAVAKPKPTAAAEPTSAVSPEAVDMPAFAPTLSLPADGAATKK